MLFYHHSFGRDGEREGSEFWLTWCQTYHFKKFFDFLGTVSEDIIHFMAWIKVGRSGMPSRKSQGLFLLDLITIQLFLSKHTKKISRAYIGLHSKIVHFLVTPPKKGFRINPGKHFKDFRDWFGNLFFGFTRKRTLFYSVRGVMFPKWSWSDERISRGVPSPLSSSFVHK